MAPFEPSRMALPSVFNHKTCNYLLYNWPTWLSWAQFCLGKWAQERWHSGSRKEQRVVEKGEGGGRGSIHGELPGLSLPDMTPPLASTVNCRKCSVKPDLNQNAMIWLLPIFHSWKSPQTGDLCHASKNAGLWRGGYKRGLPAGGHCKGLVYSSQGLVYSSLGLVYSDRTIGFSGLAEYMFYNLPSQQRPFRERLFTTWGIFWGCDLKMWRQTDYQRPRCFPVNLCKTPIYKNETEKKNFYDRPKSTFLSWHPPMFL